jgi:hypothetical protein
VIFDYVERVSTGPAAANQSFLNYFRGEGQTPTTEEEEAEDDDDDDNDDDDDKDENSHVAGTPPTFCTDLMHAVLAVSEADVLAAMSGHLTRLLDVTRSSTVAACHSSKGTTTDTPGRGSSSSSSNHSWLPSTRQLPFFVTGVSPTLWPSPPCFRC